MSGALLAGSIAACLLGARLPWASVRTFARLPAATAERAETAAGDRQRARQSVPELDCLVLLVLIDAAIASGVSLPRALGAVADAAGGDAGAVLGRASSALVLGADWRNAWRGSPARLAPIVDGLVPTWDSGSAPGPALRAAADHLSRERRRAAREAAGRLGVLLVLPLGLCFLPAFLLIGLVPALLSLGSGVLR